MSRMTAREQIEQAVEAAGWQRNTPRGEFVYRSEFYRWEDGWRYELVLTFDRAGRLEAWSWWRTQRLRIDQDTGRRERLEAFLQGGP